MSGADFLYDVQKNRSGGREIHTLLMVLMGLIANLKHHQRLQRYEKNGIIINFQKNVVSLHLPCAKTHIGVNSNHLLIRLVCDRWGGFLLPTHILGRRAKHRGKALQHYSITVPKIHIKRSKIYSIFNKYRSFLWDYNSRLRTVMV